jgi:hypothetical protein
MHNFVMPARTMDYLLMGIIAGVIAGLILVYIGGITFYAVMQAGQSIKGAFKMP